MSVHSQPQITPAHSSAHPAASRPASLTAAVGAAIGVAFVNAVGAVVLLSTVDDTVRQQIADHPVKGGAPISPDLVDPTSERGQALHTAFTALGLSTIFWALVLAALALLALRGGRTTRVLASVILAVTALLKAADVILSVPPVLVVADVLVAALAVTAIGLFFVPATNAYGRHRRAERRPGPG